MELILEGTKNVPRGGILSIKVGDKKAQAPASKIGQPFKFGATAAQPGPIFVEVLVPQGETQAVKLDPLQENFTVNVGSMQIMLRHQKAPKKANQMDVVGVAESKGVPQEKMGKAKNAAVYLERHELLNTFQDILHGLLVNQPEDPWAYLDEHLARARAARGVPPPVAQVQKGGGQAFEPVPPPSDKAAAPKGAPPTVNRGSIQSRSKVDALMEMLQKTAQNLPLILPYLPEMMREMLMSPELEDECNRQFKQYDTKEPFGKLGNEEVRPLLMDLSAGKQQSIGEDQVVKFIELFDHNEDGFIDADEYLSLSQFTLIATYLESPEGQAMMNQADSEEGRFTDFISLLEGDKERINDVIPFLPGWFVDHITSDKFMDSCLENFDSIDVDASGSLDAEELLPVVLELSKASSQGMNLEKCQRFVNIFDADKNGVISRDEFLDFAQFLAVMEFLSTTTEGQQVKEVVAKHQTLTMLHELQDKLLTGGPAELEGVIDKLPPSFSDDVRSAKFEKDCVATFESLDADGNGTLDAQELFPFIKSLSEQHLHSITDEECMEFFDLFDSDKNGVVDKGEFADLCRFHLTFAFLDSTVKWHSDEVQHSKAKIDRLLSKMQANCERLEEVLPLLPEAVQEDLMSDRFLQYCSDTFDELDTDASGALEPKELMPVVIELSAAHPFALSSEQCFRFVDMFDTERNGVITRREFVRFAQFMLVMAYLESEAGESVALLADVGMGTKKVEEMLHEMEQNRAAMHKMISYLPEDIYKLVTSQEFMEDACDKFLALDTDMSGVLEPNELYPVVMELSDAHPYSVTIEQCERFTKIFDMHNNGVIMMDEFVDFVRFLFIMSYVGSDEGKQAVGDGMQVMEGYRAINELLDALQQGRQEIRRVMPYLPDDLRSELLSQKFSKECMARFTELDVDKSGSLEPGELIPVILDMTNSHSYAMDEKLARKFTAIFDDEKTGVISRNEFVNFAQFLMIVAYLQSADGQKTLAVAEAMEIAKNSPPSSPVVQHMSVDLDFYQNKCEKLSKENETVRDRMMDMEKAMRRMEERLETQEKALRHAQVDLSSSNAFSR